MVLYFREVDGGYLQSVISSDKWEFVFYRDTKTWRGEISKAEAQASADELGQTGLEYEKTASLALSNSKTAELCVDTKDSESGIEFSWKKITSSKVKYRLGTVLLKPTDEFQIKEVLENVAETISNLRIELLEAQRKLGDSQAENTSLAMQLDKFAKLKSELECELFAKFVLILNEKKAKIKSLQEALKNSRGETKTNQSSNVNEDRRGTSKTSVALPGKNNTSRGAPKAVVRDDSFSQDLQDSLAKLPKRTRQKRSNALEMKSQPTKKVAAHINDYADEPEADDTLNASEMLEGL